MAIIILFHMRIVHLVRNKVWGGGERYVADLCRESVARGHDVSVATRGIPDVDNNFNIPGLNLLKLPLGGPLDFISPWKLSRLIKSFPENDVILHVHNFKDAEIAVKVKRRLRKVKNVAVVCTRHLVKPAGTSLRWRRLFSDIDKIIFVSELAKNEFLKTGPDISPSKIEMVHNSILPPDAPEPHKGGDIINLLFTGRITPEKGIDSLIDALAQLRDLPLRLSIAGTGSGEYVGALKRRAGEQGVADRIIWKGFVDDIYREIAEADICAAPSKWREPFGLTIIEFMSQGKPVVTTDNGAQKEIITDGVDGLLCKPDNPASLAESIRKLSLSPELREKTGRNALATFKTRFSYRVFFEKITVIYQKALRC